MKVTIFYSWQSDLPNNTNRMFIQKALEQAVEMVKAEGEELVIEPCLDRDVQGETGTPDIAETIFRKIDGCRIFVGDVSIINPRSRKARKVPNPNVMLELGYATKTLTKDFVICVYNTAFGGVGDLPFDLRTKLVCTYSITAEAEVKADERRSLASKLKNALLPMLQKISRKAVEDFAPKPLTPEAAAQRVKEYLAEERHRIQLSELLVRQAGDLAKSVSGPEFPVAVPHLGREQAEAYLKDRLGRYEELSQVCLAMIVAGCYHGTPSHVRQWVDLLQVVANPPGQRNGSVALLDLRRYPALLLLYGGGVAAAAGGHYDTLYALLSKPKLASDSVQGDDPPLRRLTPHDVLEKGLAEAAWGTRTGSPVSDHFFSLLREHFRLTLPNDRDYERCFDRFEILRSLLEVDVTGEVQSVGRYRVQFRQVRPDALREMEAEEQQAGRNWPPYQAGWFQGQRERFMAAKSTLLAFVSRLGWG